MVCRNKERGEAALAEIQSATGNQNVHLEVLFFLVDSCVSKIFSHGFLITPFFMIELSILL